MLPTTIFPVSVSQLHGCHNKLCLAYCISLLWYVCFLTLCLVGKKTGERKKNLKKFKFLFHESQLILKIFFPFSPFSLHPNKALVSWWLCYQEWSWFVDGKTSYHESMVILLIAKKWNAYIILSSYFQCSDVLLNSYLMTAECVICFILCWLTFEVFDLQVYFYYCLIPLAFSDMNPNWFMKIHY